MEKCEARLVATIPVVSALEMTRGAYLDGQMR